MKDNIFKKVRRFNKEIIDLYRNNNSQHLLNLLNSAEFDSVELIKIDDNFKYYEALYLVDESIPAKGILIVDINSTIDALSFCKKVKLVSSTLKVLNGVKYLGEESIIVFSNIVTNIISSLNNAYIFKSTIKSKSLTCYNSSVFKSRILNPKDEIKIDSCGISYTHINIKNELRFYLHGCALAYGKIVYDDVTNFSIYEMRLMNFNINIKKQSKLNTAILQNLKNYFTNYCSIINIDSSSINNMKIFYNYGSSIGRPLYFYRDSFTKIPMIATGCFRGTIKDFINSLNRTYPNACDIRRNYLNLVKHLIEIKDTI